MNHAVTSNPFERRNWSPTLAEVDKRAALARRAAARQKLKDSWFGGRPLPDIPVSQDDMNSFGDGWGAWS